jgi:Vps51/EXO84/COG1 N-terminal
LVHNRQTCAAPLLNDSVRGDVALTPSHGLCCVQIGHSIAGGAMRQSLSGSASTSNSEYNSPLNSPTASSYQAGRIDLASTLSVFGSSATFNVSSHLQQVYSNASPALAVHHRDELIKRKEQTSEELKSYVTRHYPAFIDSTASILTIESDMSQLTSMLSAFSSHLTALSSPALSYADEKLSRRGKEREKEVVAARERAVQDQMALEEWNEDLRATIYERKFDRAVRIIEHAWKRGPDNKKANATAINAVEAEMENRVLQLVETLTAELQSALMATPQQSAPSLITTGSYYADVSPIADAALLCVCLFQKRQSEALRASSSHQLVGAVG